MEKHVKTQVQIKSQTSEEYAEKSAELSPKQWWEVV